MRIAVLTTMMWLLCNISLSQTSPGGVEDLANTPFWLDAAQINQANSTSVGNWPNYGANTENATQGTAANQPLFLTNQINGQPVVSFDGTNDYLQIADNDDLNDNGPFAGRTITIVFTTGTNVTARQAIYEEGGSTRGINIYIFNGNLYFAGWNEASDGAGSPWNFASINTSITASTSYIITYVFDGNNTTTGTINGHINSVNNFGTINNIGLLYDHNNAIIGAENNGTKYETGDSNANGKYFRGRIAELVIFNQALNDSDRIILENAMAAKYGLSIGINDAYTMDTPGNGNHDFEMAGIGRLNTTDQNTSAQGPSYIRFSNPSGLGNNEYILWGHNGADESYSANKVDVPSAENIYARMNRQWRATVGGTPGTVDVSVFLDINCSADFEPDNAVLLIDTDLDNNFNDETVAGGGVITLTDAGVGEFQATGLTVTNGMRFTVGFEVNTAPTYAQVTGPGGIADGTINRFWFNVESINQIDNTALTTWSNNGGAAQTFTQGNATNRPLYLQDQQNGFAGISFDGTNDYLAMTNNADINTGGPFTSRTFFFVFNSGSNITTRQVIYEEGGSGRGLNAYMNAGLLYVGGWNYNNDGSDTPWAFSSVSTAISPNTTYLLTFEFNGNVCMTGTLNMYLNGSLIGSAGNIGRLYEHTGAIGLGAMNADSYFEDGEASGSGHYLEGQLNEFIIYNQLLFAPQRIIIENYLAAKFGLSLSDNDPYAADDNASGDFDYKVAGIGRKNGIEYDDDSQGDGAIRILNPDDLDDDEYLIWGHNNGALTANNKSDVPAGVEARFEREWRFSETNQAGSSVDIGTIDIRWDLSIYPGTSASDLALLIDTNNDGLYADETPITGAIDLGSNIFEFSGVGQVSDGVRMTLGTTDISSTPLPITLLDFQANPQYNSVELTWSTATERNNDYFTIERSEDGKDFKEITKVNGAGNSSKRLSYRTSDTSPIPGSSYYRLKQTDFDGNFEYFKPVMVNFRMSNDLLAYPNPASDFLYIKRNNAKLYDLSGNDITRDRIIENNGELFTMDLRGLPGGVYILRTGGFTQRIIRQ